jgi:hypothetical protein
METKKFETFKHDARRHASNITQSRFNQAPRVKISKIEYKGILESTYLMAECNAYKDILSLLTNNQHEDIQILIGELQLGVVNSWNAMSETKHGAKCFNKMELEDVLYDKPMDKLFKNQTIEQSATIVGCKVGV